MAGDQGADGVEHEVVERLLRQGRELEEQVEQQQQANRLLAARLEALVAHRRVGPPPEGPAPVLAGVSGVRHGAHGISRRRMLGLTGAGLLGGAVVGNVLAAPGAGAMAPPLRDGGAGALAAPRTAVLTASISAVSTFVPPPTGTAATDTANILAALSKATPGTSVVLQCASTVAPYVINQELPIPPGVRLTAAGPNNEITAAGPPSGAHTPGGLMATLQQEPGTSLLCTVASAAFLAGLYGPSNPGKYSSYLALYNNGTANNVADSAIEIDHIAFDGQNGGTGPLGNTKGHAIVLFSAGSEVHDCFIFDTAQAGIVVADTNYAGTAGSGSLDGNRIYDNTVFNCSAQAILVTATPGSVGVHNGFLLNNNLEAPSRAMAASFYGPVVDPSTSLPYEAVRMENAAGWFVVNNHPYQVPGNGWYLANAWGLHFTDNSTDDFGAFPFNGATYVGCDFHLSTPTETASPPLLPLLVNGNQLSAYEGYNTNNHNAGAGNHAPNATNTFLYYRLTMDQASQENPPGSYVEHANNSAHQDSQPAAPIAGASVTSGSSTVTFPSNVSTILQAGMSVTDAAGLIPGSTFIGSVSGSSIQLVNATGNPVAATGSSSSDTISFPPPANAGWTYVNNVAGSTLVVCRANELISPTVSPVPTVSGAGGVQIVDPSNFAGGLMVTGSPSPGQTIVVTSTAGQAVWGAPPAGVLTGTAGGVLAGSFPSPTFAAGLSTVLTSSGSYAIPASATMLRITCVGGGGGGGGGGAATSSIAQAGGGGGAAGTASTQVVPVGANSSLTVTVGLGGPGGSGGAAGGDNPGGSGGSGGDSTVTGIAVSVRGTGGGGGRGAAAASIVATRGTPYGGPSGSFTADITGGSGGGSSQAGGDPIAGSPGGGGGGGAAAGGLGGGSGGAGSASSSGNAGASGASSGPSGIGGSSATDLSGGGGGGGGGGGASGGGGQGGAGAGGFVVIEIVG